MCGGTRKPLLQRREPLGLSPRVRGNPERLEHYTAECGSIPACAGEPSRVLQMRLEDGVYPRVCGGTPASWPCAMPSAGLSPRVRGNHGVAGPSVDCGGSIPACAGEPQYSPLHCITMKVYPRVCGGTYVRLRSAGPEEGLSPRVRGNLRRRDARAQRHGSIPACAGEPR